MSRVLHLYVKTDRGVRGPLSVRTLRQMVEAGLINAGSEVSLDGSKWIAARSLKGLLEASRRALPATPQKEMSMRKGAARRNESISATIPELRRILSQVQRAVKVMPYAFTLSIWASFALTAVGSAVGLFMLGQMLAPAAAAALIVIAVLIPALLVAAAVAHGAGNFALRLMTGLSAPERRCLALHLPWSRTPGYWPRYLRKWIYCGDWLVDRFSHDLLPYVRAFVTGDAPATIEEELETWVELMNSTRASCAHEIEVGKSVRELACVEKLPAWTEDVEPGTSLPDLEEKLGDIGHDWAVNLLKRAATRMQIFAQIDTDGDLHEASFEFHYCEMSGDRKGLLVILRPKFDHPSRVMVDDTRSDEIAA